MTKITKRDIRGIEEWLEYSDNYKCPFDHVLCSGHLNFGYKETGWQKCKIMFPNLRAKTCPCGQYKSTYVIRKARATVKKFKEKS
jgi:hypothetical protein